MRIERRGDPTELAAAIASALIEVCRARQASGHIPCVVLTGGTGGGRALAAVAAHPERDSVDWSRVRFLWGDERWVPDGHEDRNDLLADRALLEVIPVDPELVHRVPAADSGLSLEEAAASYAAIVAGVGRIDLALNGVGEDGHVASLFPGRNELSADEADTPDALAIRDSPKPPPERVTLSLPALRRAERVWLIAAGAGKADAVRGIIARTEPLIPACLVPGTAETVLWADTAALRADTHASS